MRIVFMTSGSIGSSFTHRAVSVSGGLAALGHDVTIIAPKADKYNDFKSKEIHEINGVTVKQPFQFATKNIVLNLLPYMLAAAISVLRARPGIVYIYKPTPISIVGLVGRLFRRTIIVLDMDDLGSEVMRQEGHPAYQRLLVAICEKLSARYAKKIVVTSTYLKELFIKQYPNKPVYILPNGVDDFMLKSNIVTPKKLKDRVVFFGAMNRKTILEPLFDALPEILKSSPQARLLIIGDGKYLDYFKTKVKNMGLSGQAQFTGWLALKDALKLFEAGDIGYSFMPDEVTVRAASNMKVTQYMAYGLVPLVSDVGDSKLMIKSGAAGYIAKAGDISNLTETILKAFSDANRLDKAVFAQRIAREEYSWKDLVNTLEAWLLLKGTDEV